MSDSKDSNNPSPQSARRSSFASQALADIFGTNRTRPSFSGTDQNNQGNPVNSYPGPITSAAAQAQRRRMSLSGIGMGASPGQGNTNGFKRSDSISSSNSGAIDENAVEDGDPMSQSSPTTPFARRMSFGARALRDVRAGSSPGGGGGGGVQSNGRSSIAESGVSAGTGGDGGKKTTPPNVKGRDNGYNWADNFRSRAERSTSIASQGGTSPNLNHTRAKSVATMQPPVQQAPPRPMVPDHMQERILKGDFYMD